MIPIVSGFRNFVRNTKLQAEAMVQQCSNGSMPGSPSVDDVMSMNNSRNFKQHILSMSTSERQYLSSSFWKSNGLFLLSVYHS